MGYKVTSYDEAYRRGVEDARKWLRTGGYRPSNPYPFVAEDYLHQEWKMAFEENVFWGDCRCRFLEHLWDKIKALVNKKIP